MIRRYAAALLILFAGLLAPPAIAQAAPPGIVVMHGKGGAPSKHVAQLAAALASRGYLVANLEMPWSGRRDYDTDVAGAEQEVAQALAELRRRGAGRLFVAGHSQGGLFALYFGGRQAVDGIVAIAPGGSAGGPLFKEKLGEAVARARQLVADGKGGDKTQLLDYEGGKGTYPIITTPANYLSWFSPDGAMDQTQAVRRLPPGLPVLLVVPKNDYPGLLRLKQATFEALPRQPLTRLYEPEASHLEAPSAAVDEIVRWTREVAAAGERP